MKQGNLASQLISTSETMFLAMIIYSVSPYRFSTQHHNITAFFLLQLIRFLFHLLNDTVIVGCNDRSAGWQDSSRTSPATLQSQLLNNVSRYEYYYTLGLSRFQSTRHPVLDFVFFDYVTFLFHLCERLR
jgi:hypothetical protein